MCVCVKCVHSFNSLDACSNFMASVTPICILFGLRHFPRVYFEQKMPFSSPNAFLTSCNSILNITEIPSDSFFQTDQTDRSVWKVIRNTKWNYVVMERKYVKIVGWLLILWTESTHLQCKWAGIHSEMRRLIQSDQSVYFAYNDWFVLDTWSTRHRQRWNVLFWN